MPLSSGDEPSALSFTVTIDGIPLAQVVEVSGLKAEVDIIEIKQQTQDGKYVTRQLIGRPKPGQFTVTRVLSADTTMTDWIALVMRDDVTGARKTVTVALVEPDGTALRTFTFANCWVQRVEVNALRSGMSESPTEAFVVCHDEATIS